jgi:hypothetical protein
MSAMGKASELGALSLVIVSVSFFVFMMFKVPLYGAYKLSAATYGVFKLAWWVIFGLLSLFSMIEYGIKEERVVLTKTPGRRDRLRAKARSAEQGA